MKSKVFVIVVTYKGHQWYNRCFSSLRESSIPITTIVVDNASNDGTVEYIKEHFPEIILIESKENLGFGRANNIAMRYALDHGCDYVFLLNQDAWLDTHDTIDKLVSIANQYPEYGIISPMHLNVNRTKLVMSYFCMQPTNEKLITDLYFGTLSDIYSTTYIHAAAWLLPRNTLEMVGGFAPIFFHYGEDDNYINRVIFHKLKIGVCPKLRIIHDHQSGYSYARNRTNLVRYTNINISFNPYLLILHNFKKLIKCFFANRSQIRLIWNDIKYIYYNDDNICSCRNLTVQKGVSVYL